MNGHAVVEPMFSITVFGLSGLALLIASMS